MRLAELGYHVEPQVLPAAECVALCDFLSTLEIPRGRAGARHLMSHHRIRALAEDPRMVAIASAALNAAATPFRATLFEKSTDANWLIPWHQDTALPFEHRFEAPGWGPWSTKSGILHAHAPAWALSRVIALRVHLDRSTTENGPLRAIAASHLWGVLSDDQVHEYVASHSVDECVSPQGGVLVMRPLLIHSSSKARSIAPRRVLHFEYAEALSLGPGMRLAIT